MPESALRELFRLLQHPAIRRRYHDTQKGLSMGAILTGGNTLKKCASYKLLQTGATVFLLTTLMACAKVPAPVEPEMITDGEGDAQATQTIPTVQYEPFNFTYDWQTSVPLEILMSASVAAQIWETFIVEGLPDVNDSRVGGHIDDLLVSISMATEDKPGAIGNTLATAGPVYIRSDSLGLPYYGRMVIYPALADTARFTMEEQTRIIMHELGHVLGFVDYYLERVGTETIAGVRYFNGTAAAEGYKLLLYYGLGEKLTYAIPGLRVPLMNDSPHWRFPALSWELMSPFAGVFGDKIYITGVTILAMKDLGYVTSSANTETPPFESVSTKLAVHKSRFFCDGTHMHVVAPK